MANSEYKCLHEKCGITFDKLNTTDNMILCKCGAYAEKQIPLPANTRSQSDKPR